MRSWKRAYYLDCGSFQCTKAVARCLQTGYNLDTMIDPWVIEEERKKQKRQQERPQIQLPIPEYEPTPKKPEPENPGIIVIQF